MPTPPLSRRQSAPQRSVILFAVLLVGAASLSAAPGAPLESPLLQPEGFRPYVEQFNAQDEELYPQAIPNAAAWTFLSTNIPLFECPDPDLQRTYYFRWWTYRKHLKHTPDGFIVTEFLPPVPWAGKHNSINCPAGHHFYEGRWLWDRRYLDDYGVFWFRKGGDPRRYSFWAADALYARSLVTGDPRQVIDLLPDLVRNDEEWEKKRRDPNGLFWQEDGQDGMEVAIGGTGYRATIGSYMFGDAVALATIAELAGRAELVTRFREQAAVRKRLVQERLWDPAAQFFKVAARQPATTGDTRLVLADVRELHGFTPWYFNLPDPAFAIAWKQVTDTNGFLAPFGLTTAEQRHPRFTVAYQGHECQWNGPSWPYATAITLTALAQCLNGPPQPYVTKADYFRLLRTYARSHQLKRPDGQVVPWIDENLNPFTGDWIARTLLRQRQQKPVERGKDYNHSSFCDLVITGLVGLRPRPDTRVEANPLLPAGTWDWFALDRIPYHGHSLTLLWDSTGTHYARGKGFRLFADGKELAASPALGPLVAELPAAPGRLAH
jgi:hypothetical protein